MILIGERINGLFGDVAEAIREKNPRAIQEWAVRQTEAGATYLDINTGPAVDDPAAVMPWLVGIVEEVVDTPLCLDSAKVPALEAGLQAITKSKPLLNSTTAEENHLTRFVPLAAKYGAGLIGLSMNKRGVPRDAADRIALAMEIVVAADAAGLPMTDLYIDPLVLPVNVGQDHAREVLETIRQTKLLADPAPRTVVGLSNISQKCPHRDLINRTYLAMAMAAGLDAAVADVMDVEFMHTVKASRVLLNEVIYSDAFLDA